MMLTSPGLFAPRHGQQYRDDQRRRRSQFDRGTTAAEYEARNEGLFDPARDPRPMYDRRPTYDPRQEYHRRPTYGPRQEHDPRAAYTVSPQYFQQLRTPRAGPRNNTY